MIQGYFLIMDTSFQNNDQFSKLVSSQKSLFLLFSVFLTQIFMSIIVFILLGTDPAYLIMNTYFECLPENLCLNFQPSRAGILGVSCDLSQGSFSHLIGWNPEDVLVWKLLSILA